jgi:cellulose synthase/poly-beta-1,6-N-acetylglucosamine synthase-like glycosyltransferase
MSRFRLALASGRPSGRPRLPGRVLGVVLILAASAAVGLLAITYSLFPYVLYVALSLVVGTVAVSTLTWMLYAWQTPGSLAASRLEADGRPTACSFSLIVPARHEEAVLQTTLSRLVRGDHPDFEVLVVVGDDDPGTREVAERMAGRYPGRLKVVVDDRRPKSKPKALNAALPHCSGAITGVFDAEDDVHPALLRRVDQCFQATEADIVQAGVQLMNFRSHWFTVHNVLEYYFWFRSRLHVHARQGFIPLGGNTVFIRTAILRAVSGWADCLAEDCEIGVRLSALGARTAVFYEPELVTREECPATVGAFVRQRTRWNQGYLQTLARGYWRRLPLRQRMLGLYILASPYVMALAWVMIPAAIATAVAVKAPIAITLLSFLPLLPMLAMLVAEGVGLAEFCRAYGERPAARDYARLVLGLLPYQSLLAYAAARAVIRQARGVAGWEKTAHLGQHLGRSAVVGAGPGKAVSARSAAAAGKPDPVLPALATELAGLRQFTRLRADALVPDPVTQLAATPRPYEYAGAAANAAGLGNGHTQSRDGEIERLFGDVGGAPLWARLDGEPPGGGPPAPPGVPARGRLPLAGGRLAAVPALLMRSLRAHRDIAVQVPLLTFVGYVQAMNMFHWPAILFDEGTYVGNAWAIGNRGELAFYTYTYGHPPLAWLLLTVWTSAGALFGHAAYSLDGARELMCAVTVASCSLLYTLARRLGMNRVFAVLAVLLFALSPLSLYFHRGMLLDNPATAWVIAAFVLALSPQRRLWSFAGSGACFAAGVLSKETVLVILPALVLAAFQNADPRTRSYCVTLLASSFALVLGLYPLYATLKGELLPGPGHVSLLGTDVNMVATRQGTGSVFAQGTVAHGTVTGWLALDPWLVGAGLLLSPLALAVRSTRAAALAYLIQVAMIVRPGYLPAMYVIALLPFAALIVAGTMHALWRFATDGHAGRRGSARGASRHVLWAWLSDLATKAAAAASAIALAATAAVAVTRVVPRWANVDRDAMSLRLDTPELEADRWLLQHVGHEQRLIVTDDFWVYLIEHGYDSHPVQGGFNSPTVVSYWPLDKDPAVKRFFPYSWREFNYIVSTPAMRDTSDSTPNTAQALQNSTVVAAFGKGREAQIQIRAITPTPLGSGSGIVARHPLYRVPLSGKAPSLEQIARRLHVKVPEIVVQTNWHAAPPAWWYYEARHDWKAPLPRGMYLY